MSWEIELLLAASSGAGAADSAHSKQDKYDSVVDITKYIVQCVIDPSNKSSSTYAARRTASGMSLLFSKEGNRDLDFKIIY